jgi:PhnB protein
MKYKPDGYTSLAPYLIVPDAEAVLDFAEAVFAAERLRVIRDEAGTIRHAECRIDDTVLMVGQMPENPLPAYLHVYVADARATHARAIEAGAEEVQPPTDKRDGDLRGGVRDAQRVTWWIAEQL